MWTPDALNSCTFSKTGLPLVQHRLCEYRNRVSRCLFRRADNFRASDGSRRNAAGLRHWRYVVLDCFGATSLPMLCELCGLSSCSAPANRPTGPARARLFPSGFQARAWLAAAFLRQWFVSGGAIAPFLSLPGTFASMASGLCDSRIARILVVLVWRRLYYLRRNIAHWRR